jgi:RHS repeat-associated protein
VDFGLLDTISSTVATVNQNGIVDSQFFYEPFGQTSAMAETYPFQFTGRVPVAGSLYLYRRRYYHQIVGRFVSEDPIGFGGGDVNFYRYVRNRPVKFRDLSGLRGDPFDVHISDNTPQGNPVDPNPSLGSPSNCGCYLTAVHPRPTYLPPEPTDEEQLERAVAAIDAYNSGLAGDALRSLGKALCKNKPLEKFIGAGAETEEFVP